MAIRLHRNHAKSSVAQSDVVDAVTRLFPTSQKCIPFALLLLLDEMNEKSYTFPG